MKEMGNTLMSGIIENAAAATISVHIFVGKRIAIKTNERTRGARHLFNVGQQDELLSRMNTVCDFGLFAREY